MISVLRLFFVNVHWSFCFARCFRKNFCGETKGHPITCLFSMRINLSFSSCLPPNCMNEFGERASPGNSSISRDIRKEYGLCVVRETPQGLEIRVLSLQSLCLCISAGPANRCLPNSCFSTSMWSSSHHPLLRSRRHMNLHCLSWGLIVL